MEEAHGGRIAEWGGAGVGAAVAPEMAGGRVAGG